MTYKISFYIITCILIIFCIIWWNNTPPPVTSSDPTTIQKALKLRDNYLLNFTGASSGFNFIDNTMIMTNNVSGEIVPPCKDGLIIFPKEETYQNTKKSILKTITPEEKDCNVAVIDIDADSLPSFLASIQASKSIINGTVRKNGTDIPAKFVVQITATYEGSKIYGILVGGVYREIELENDALCQSIYQTGTENKTKLSKKAYKNLKSLLKSLGCLA